MACFVTFVSILMLIELTFMEIMAGVVCHMNIYALIYEYLCRIECK